jgi:hypothetical protein
VRQGARFGVLIATHRWLTNRRPGGQIHAGQLAWARRGAPALCATVEGCMPSRPAIVAGPRPLATPQMQDLALDP